MEIALRKEFDYLVPPDLVSQVEVGSRVKVPFGPRQVMGCVTALPEESTHTNLRSILKVVGGQSLVTPKVLQLARWIADYYCCPVEIALKSVLPEAVRKEKEGWRERLFVRALRSPNQPPDAGTALPGLRDLAGEGEPEVAAGAGRRAGNDRDPGPGAVIGPGQGRYGYGVLVTVTSNPQALPVPREIRSLPALSQVKGLAT